MSQAAEAYRNARRIVFKVGSALLVDDETGAADRAWLEAFCADAAALRAAGKQVLVVSSGAVALGRRRLGLTGRKATLPEKQAAAAAGQSLLMRAWEEAFEPHGTGVAQILLTESYRYADVSTIAPFEYTALAWGLALDWFVWSVAPAWRMLAGAAVIIAAGVYLVHRERVHVEAERP